MPWLFEMDAGLVFCGYWSMAGDFERAECLLGRVVCLLHGTSKNARQLKSALPSIFELLPEMVLSSETSAEGNLRSSKGSWSLGMRVFQPPGQACACEPRSILTIIPNSRLRAKFPCQDRNNIEHRSADSV